MDMGYAYEEIRLRSMAAAKLICWRAGSNGGRDYDGPSPTRRILIDHHFSQSAQESFLL